MNRHENLAKVSKDLMLKEPFYGLFLIMLNKVWTDKVPTAGVGRNGINYQLYINPAFWDSLTDIQRMGLLKHELLHMGFMHVTEFDHLTDKELRNVAMDIEINQYIDESWLPEGGCTIKSIEKSLGIKLKTKMGTKYYYDELMKVKSQMSKDLMKAIGDSHASWEEFDDMDEATQKLIVKQTEHILTELADSVKKSTGNIPGEFEGILKRIMSKEPPKFDWRGYLRRFAGSSMEIYTKKLRRKPNKRFEENPGLKIKKRRHILVAVDTSGSVNNDELKEFFHEIDHIHKTGCEVTVIQCDTSIRHKETYKRNMDIRVYGRGGTTFDPVIDYYNASNGKYSCLVYLTDGEASAPPKTKGRMLWVLSSQSKRNPELIGPQIVLN
jgi:predicted metal-dependent peptidase